MRLKKNVLAYSDAITELLETSMLSMEKHKISPDKLYANLKTIHKNMEAMVTLINREPDEG